MNIDNKMNEPPESFPDPFLDTSDISPDLLRAGLDFVSTPLPRHVAYYSLAEVQDKCSADYNALCAAPQPVVIIGPTIISNTVNSFYRVAKLYSVSSHSKDNKRIDHKNKKSSLRSSKSTDSDSEDEDEEEEELEVGETYDSLSSPSVPLVAIEPQPAVELVGNSLDGYEDEYADEDTSIPSIAIEPLPAVDPYPMIGIVDFSDVDGGPAPVQGGPTPVTMTDPAITPVPPQPAPRAQPGSFGPPPPFPGSDHMPPPFEGDHPHPPPHHPPIDMYRFSLGYSPAGDTCMKQNYHQLSPPCHASLVKLYQLHDEYSGPGAWDHHHWHHSICDFWPLLLVALVVTFLFKRAHCGRHKRFRAQQVNAVLAAVRADPSLKAAVEAHTGSALV